MLEEDEASSDSYAATLDDDLEDLLASLGYTRQEPTCTPCMLVFLIITSLLVISGLVVFVVVYLDHVGNAGQDSTGLDCAAVDARTDFFVFFGLPKAEPGMGPDLVDPGIAPDTTANKTFSAVDKVTLKDQSVYLGEWKFGQPHGRGTLYSADGRDVWEGTWRAGRRQGIGAWTTSAGNKKFAQGWLNGNLVNQAVWNSARLDENGVPFSGHRLAGTDAGEKELPLKDDWHSPRGGYDGFWGEGKMEGVGRRVTGSGCLWEGTWVAGFKTGVAYSTVCCNKLKRLSWYWVHESSWGEVGGR